MKNLFLSIFLFSFGQAKAQCVKLYVKEHLSGSRICKLMQGDYIEICEDDKEVNGCPYDFFIYDKGFASGSLTYELSLDRGWSTHYMSLFVNPSTKRFGFIQQGQTAIYSYNTEAEMTAIRARQKEQENIANQKLVEQAKIEDKQTKISINNALDGKEYFKALQLFSNLYFKDNELLNKINVGWLPEKERLDKIYLTYTEQFIQLKKEYHSASITDFLLKYQNNIKTKEITINGKEAYLKRIDSTIDPSFKIYREKTLSEDGYLYLKRNNKHLIAPAGIDGNYLYTGRYNNKKVNSLNIEIMYDTSANTHVPMLVFKNNEKLIARCPIINTNTFQIKYFSMPFPSEINKIYQKIINDSGRKTLESMYSEKILNLDYYESILYSGLIEMEYPGDGKRNDKYESLKSEFEIFRKDVEKLTKDKRKLVTTNFYNPSILYLVKKMYPNADSLVFAFGDYKESLGKLGLHINYATYDEAFAVRGGSFVPLTKGVVELKNDKFIIYDKSGNYAEVSANLILTESKVSLTNLLVDSLSLDSTFFRYDRGAEWGVAAVGYIGQYPISFEQLELRYNENVAYIFNENLSIQRLPVYQLSDIYFPSNRKPIVDPIYNLVFDFNRAAADEADEYKTMKDNLKKYYSSATPSDGFARKYFNEMTKYFQYKKEMNSKEATKSLLKANQYLESFKQIYFNSK
jgi:hypothetical protein